MYAARLQRPAPYVDKTVYVNWNALMISAYLQASSVLGLDQAREFALKSLDRVLTEAWDGQKGLKHVIAYSDPEARHRETEGLLDDYAFLGIAALDAFEVTGEMRCFEAAKRLSDYMIEHFYDEQAGGFFDAPKFTSVNGVLGALSAQRKPFQDSPTPSGNSSAAVLLLRMHALTNDSVYRDRAQRTLQIFAGLAEQVGIFAGTYGIAAVHLFRPHTQVIVIGGDQDALRLYAAAIAPFALNKSVIRVNSAHQELPPALAATVANLPAAKGAKPVALVCSSFVCQPPISDPDQLVTTLQEVLNR
jgi:uncharacterized protein YyaL (SSP411 family)